MYQTFYSSGSACNLNIAGWNTASVATVCQSWAAFPFLLAGIV
jgi:surface protein